MGSMWVWHCWCHSPDGAVCREIKAKGRDAAARRCVERYGVEPHRVVSVGYAAEETPRQVSRGNARKLRLRAVHALEVYRDVREDWPLPGILSETTVSQETWRCFMVDVGVVLSKLPRSQQRVVEQWLAGRREMGELPARVLQALSHLDDLLDGETLERAGAALAWALIRMQEGVESLTAKEALERAERGRRVRVPGEARVGV